MWTHLTETEVQRRYDVLMTYANNGVPDPGNAIAYYCHTHGDIPRAREIWTKFARESDEQGRFLFPVGSEYRDGYGGTYGSRARHPLTPTEELEVFARDQNPETRGEVGMNPATPEGLLRELSEDSDPFTRVSMVGNPACPPDLLRSNMWVLIEDDEEFPSVTWGAIAGNPTCPVDVLDRYIESEETWDEVQQGESLQDAMENLFHPLARNVSLRLEDLHRLTRHWHGWVRWGVAGNPITPVALLAELATDPDTLVRSSVGRHLMVPDEIREVLASDEAVSVRASVAVNPMCSIDLLEALSLDMDSSRAVQKAILSNPSSTERAKSQAAHSLR